MSRSGAGIAGGGGPMALTLRLSPTLARLLVLAAAGIVTVVALVLFDESGRVAEERLGSQAWRLTADPALEERITVIAVDEKSLAEVGPWPWPRRTMADLANALREAGVQTQLYDIVFPEARTGDEAFVTALEEGNAVLAQTPVPGAEQSLQVGRMTHPVNGPACTGLTSTPHYVANHAGFSAIPKGHITPRVDGDGGVRRIPALLCVNADVYPALAVSALLNVTSPADSGWRVSLTPGDGLLSPPFALTLPDYPGLSVPLDRQGNLRMSYRRHPDSFQAISAVDLLNGEFDAAMLENTWALVGSTAFGMGDVVPTPYSGAAPGVELQARLIASLLDGDVPFTPRGATLLKILLGLVIGALLLGLAGFRERPALYGLPAAALLLPAGAWARHAGLLLEYGLWIGWLAPAVFAMLAASSLAVLEHSRIRLEHNRVYSNLNSYLPEGIAREIAYSLPRSDIDARRLDVTLLSADLRNYSAYTEARPPEESAALLHYFFTLATDIIERHGGRVHEFKGDGLLAVWSGGEPGVRHSLRAAEELQVAIRRDMLPAHAPAGLEPLDLGIGIEQGPALIGSIGPSRRRTHILLGDTVTIALRIQEMTAELALPILLGEGAAGSLPGERGGEALQSQGRYLLNGLRVPHVLYAPAAPEGTWPETSGSDGPVLKVVTGGRQD